MTTTPRRLTSAQFYHMHLLKCETCRNTWQEDPNTPAEEIVNANHS